MLYTTVAYRFADTERHSYIVAICSTLAKAKYFADQEEDQRAGKYSCRIYESELDSDEIEVAFETASFKIHHKDLGEKYAAFKNKSNL
jgi:hypothetical protein